MAMTTPSSSSRRPGGAGGFPRGTPLLQAARELGVDIDSVCGGRALCGRCQITLSEGEFAKHGISSRADHVSPPARPRSATARATGGWRPGRRLSCQTQLQGDVVIDVPPDSQVHKQVVRKRAEVRAIELDPVVRLHYVEVEPARHARAARRPAAPAGGARASSGSWAS